MDNHLTHLCPKLEEAARILSLPPVMLKNHFPHNQHMASSSLNAKNVASGSQNPLVEDDDHLWINMVKYEVNVATRSHNYSSSQTIPSLKSPPPLKMSLQIEKIEPPPRIMKGVLKFSTHNPNARVVHKLLYC
jgi:hypothetical protein